MDTRSNLEAWLRNAHAMEENVIKSLERQRTSTAGYPELNARIQQHLEETHRHKDLVEQCLRMLDTSASTVKTMVGWAAGMMSGMMTGMSDDEAVRNVVMDYAMEHLEIGTYETIVAMAEATDMIGIADICREILEDEERMAAWLRGELPEITRNYTLAHRM
jgi:ferritin-like metal-binding protein YciE